MNELFLTLLNMSIAASWTILALLLLRPLLRKAPKWISCLLWSIPALRLLIPAFWESDISLMPSAQVIPTNITQAETPIIYSGISQVNSTVNPLLTQSADKLSAILEIATVAWLIGAGLMLLYSLISWLYLRFTVRASMHYRDRIYLCDDVKSPFIFGIFRPRIYLPSGLDAGTMTHVLAHENAHLKRKDHLWKPFGYLLLSIYWVNPLMWVAYILLCRDIERACDEKVLTGIDDPTKKAYAKALIDCSTHRRMILTCPVAFGEVCVKSRIRAVRSYKKPAFWVVLLAVIISVVTSVCFLTNPKTCDHNYKGEITLAATCTQKGNETFTCTDCGHTYMELIAPCAHSFGAPKVLKASDCVSNGSEELTCLDCGFVATQQLPLAADVHDLHTSTLKAPACGVLGQSKTHCSRCSYEEYHDLPALEHQYEVVEFQAATCGDYGKQVKKCIHCGLEETHKLHPSGLHRFALGSAKCLDCNYEDPNRKYSFFGEHPPVIIYP